MRQAIFLWCLSLFFLLFFGWPQAVFAQVSPPSYFQRKTLPVEEQQYKTENGAVPCPQVDLLCQDRPGTNCFSQPPIYTSADGTETPAVRGDAGLEFNTSVKGLHCAQVKSTPIILNESSDYCLGKAGCYNPSWIGELQMPNNLKIPFAQEMADHWAGTMDTEHLTPDEYDSLVARASQNVSVNPGIGYLSMAALEDKISAQNEINQRTGVIQKLTTMDEQDTLKCNFAKWTAQVRVAGRPSIYKGYQPDGKVMIQLLGPPACRQEVCPVGMPDRATCLKNYDDGTYLAYDPNHGGWYAPGPAWKYLGLIPNENSTGQLIFTMAHDKAYPVDVPYPQVFRLGLAANELFRIFTTKQKQDEFYTQMDGGKYKNLSGNPLDKNNPGEDNLWQVSGEEMVLGPITQILAQNQPVNKQPDKKELLTNKEDKLRQKLNSQQTFLHKLLSLVQKFWPKVQVALAKSVEKNKSFISMRNLFAQGNVTNPNPGGSGTSPGGTTPPGSGPSSSPAPSSSGPQEESGSGSGSGGGAACENVPGSFGTCGNTCSNNQFNPSDTTVWPVNNPFMHVVFGVKITDPTVLGGFNSDPVNHVQYDYLDGKGVRVGYCDLAKTIIKKNVSQTRLVDVYNKVPFLVSAWTQSADPTWGFMSNIKPSNIFGAGNLPNDAPNCTMDQNIVLDQKGNYQAPHAAFNWDYGFQQFPPPDTYLDNAESMGVTLDTKKGKILFYQLGGLCNANMWWTQRVLNPFLKTVVQSETGSRVSSPLDCGPDKNKIDLLKVCMANGAVKDPNFANKIWTWDFCKEVNDQTDPEPSCCQQLRNDVEKETTLEGRREASNNNCGWPDRGHCKECPSDTMNRLGGNCGLFRTTFNKKGSDILSGNADSCVPK